MSCRPRLLLRSFPCSFRCVWRLAARRIRPARSSGRANLAPLDRRISSKLRPVASRTPGTPKPSRRRTPIAAAERPSWCRRKIVSSISAFSIATHQLSHAADRVCLDRMELVEPVEHSPSSENKKSELDGQPARSRIESGLFETNDLDALLPDVRPRLKRGRSCGRAMPKFEHEKAVRFEMSPEAAEGLQRVSFRQQISEGPEHAHGRVERSAESKRAHVGADEPGSHA